MDERRQEEGGNGYPRFNLPALAKATLSLKFHRELAGKDKGSEADTEIGVGPRISIWMGMVGRDGERKETGGRKGCFCGSIMGLTSRYQGSWQRYIK